MPKLTRRELMKGASAYVAGTLAGCGGGSASGGSVEVNGLEWDLAGAVPTVDAVANQATRITLRNTGKVGFDWTLSGPSQVTITPSVGRLDAGASVDITLVASQTGSFALSGKVEAGSDSSSKSIALAVSPPSMAVATAMTLHVPESGTNGLSSLVIVTPNAPVGAGGVEVTIAASDGAALGTGTLRFDAGATAGLSTTIVRGATGISTVTISNSAGLASVGSPATYTTVPPLAGGSWAQLTVGPHQRRVITISGNGTIGTFDATKARLVEAQAPITVTAVPARAFSLPVPGERGMVYLVGGLHSNYQGNEIDRMAMPLAAGKTEIRTDISHQPNMPPEGPYSGYAVGASGYIYRQYDGGTADPADWQPYPGHQWTKTGWSPEWGFFSLSPHPLSKSDGSLQLSAGVPVCSSANPGDVWPPGTPVAKQDYGAVGFDWTTGKYKVHLSTVGLPFPQNLLGQSGVSDWNNFDQSIVFLTTNAGITYIQQWRQGGNYGLVTLPSTALVGGYDATGGNGLLIRALELRKYLILRQDGGGSFRTRTKLLLYSEDFGSGDQRFVTLAIPEQHTADVADNVDALTFTVDRNSRRVFWMVFPNVGVPVRFYVSTFEDLMDWRPIRFTPDIVIPDTAYANAWLAANRQPLLFQDGYLFLMDGSGSGPGIAGYNDGNVNWKRVRVDGGEDLPPMNFRRYDYRLQNFQFSSDPGALQLWGNKHANWAYRPENDTHYLCAGDLGGSTNHSLATLKFDTSARGYTFAETLNETDNPKVAGTFRPCSTDDGYFFHVPQSSAWTQARGKFVWQRGGDGEDLFWNVYLRRKYGAADQVGTAAQRAAALADGWDGTARFYLFDPDTTTFPVKFDGSGWTQDNGGAYFPDVWTAASAASRNGYFDPTTGCVWRFYNNTGFTSLARFDFVNRKVTMFNVGLWTSPDTKRLWYTYGPQPGSAADLISDGPRERFGFLDASTGRYTTSLGLNWEHKATWLDERDGKLYAVEPATGYLWCFETRGPVTTGGGGNTIPFYPVGDRVPLVGTFPSTNARDSYPPKVQNLDTRMSQFLVPFKGGLLWWGACQHTQGTFGHPVYAFWRRLGYTGPWTVVSMPREFAANTFSVRSTSINNDEVVMLSGGGNAIDTRGPWPWFWRLT